MLPRRVFHVALTGRDDWSGIPAAPNKGHTDGPFATLERAREEIRRMKRRAGLPKGGVMVELRGGVYALPQPFALTAADSGSAAAPVIYRARPGAEVRLSGGKLLSGFRPITDPAILNRLAKPARGKVFQTDLRAQGISDYGQVTENRLELFFQDRPMIPARWPNEGFARIADVVERDGHKIHGLPGSKTGKFTYAGDRPGRWLEEKDIWLHGYWFWDWSDQRQKVAAIDPARRMITLVPPFHGYGYRKGQWFYAFNVLAELDAPGEWFLDRQAGMLYFWPPAAIAPGQPTVSRLATLVTLQDAAHITLAGFVLEASRGTAITITGGAHNRVLGCTIRNTGSWAARIAGGAAHGVADCDIFATGDGGIAMDGGDRKTLTAAGHYAENNHIHDYSRWNRMYQPAIALSGVGQRAAHNRIHNAPHEAIAFSGNDHLIEFNEIYNVCNESNDAGAIYSGRDWTWRGTVIRHNFLHHIRGFEGRGCIGVYLDDMLCGTRIFGNVFYKMKMAVLVGGGRDNLIENNIFMDCYPAVHVDARAMNWAAYHVATTMTERLRAMPYRRPPWPERYPSLPAILKDAPAAPKGNVIARNIFRGGRWDDIEELARPLVKFAKNLLDREACFMNAAGMNFQLRDKSPAWRRGFRRIPLEKIGLYQDRHRRSLPSRELVESRLVIDKPLVRRAGKLEPGVVRLELFNAGDCRVAWPATLVIAPETAGIIRGKTTFRCDLGPGRKKVSPPITVAPAAGIRELAVRAKAGLPAIVPTGAAVMRIHPEVRLPRLPASASAADLARAWRNRPPLLLKHANTIVAELRLGVAGNELAMQARVVDRRMAQGAVAWEGSCIEMFGAMLGGEDIGQVILLPAVDAQPGRVECYRNMKLQAGSPDIRLATIRTASGYEMRARIPLARLACGPEARRFFLLEISVNAAPANVRRRARLFGSSNPASESVQYGVMRIGYGI